MNYQVKVLQAKGRTSRWTLSEKLKTVCLTLRQVTAGKQTNKQTNLFHIAAFAHFYFSFVLLSTYNYRWVISTYFIYIQMPVIVVLQEAESNRLCRRLQLKDIIPVEMQRVTKYPLLLDNIAKYTGIRMSEMIFASPSWF